MPSIPDDYKRILIVKLSAIGDVVMTTPVAKALRNAFPESYIAWAVDDRCRDVLVGNPYLDEILVWRRSSGSKAFLGRPAGFLAGLLQLVRETRGRKFDLAIDFQGLLRSALVARMSGARHRVGYDNAREGAALFYDLRVPSRKLKVRGPQQYLNMLQLLNISSTDLDMCVPIGEADRAFAQAFLKAGASGNPGHSMIVSLCPATTWPHKHWTEEGWARLADALVSDYNALPVFLGSGADSRLVGTIREMMKSQAADATGKTNLKQAAALLERSDLAIAVDTGPLHMAMALDRPTVGIFGPTGWQHLTKKETFAVVVKEFPCMPCLRHPTCKEFDCMRAVTAEDVLAAAAPWLKKTDA